MTTTPKAAEALAVLRGQIAMLTSQIDAGFRPPPDEASTGRDMPGPVWRPGENWAVRCIDDGYAPPIVYLSPPGANGDLTATHTTVARRLATAILAACDWADERAAGVPSTDSHR